MGSAGNLSGQTITVMKNEACSLGVGSLSRAGARVNQEGAHVPRLSDEGFLRADGVLPLSAR